MIGERNLRNRILFAHSEPDFNLRDWAFPEQTLKGGKCTLFFDGFHGFAEQKKTAGVVGDGKRVAISAIEW